MKPLHVILSLLITLAGTVNLSAEEPAKPNGLSQTEHVDSVAHEEQRSEFESTLKKHEFDSTQDSILSTPLFGESDSKSDKRRYRKAQRKSDRSGPTNDLALISFIAGIVAVLGAFSIFFVAGPTYLFFFGILVTPLALILGIIALAQIIFRRGENGLGFAIGLAITGIILGVAVIGLVISLLRDYGGP